VSRVNIEDDLIASGRLGTFMRAAKLFSSSLPDSLKDELVALGALTFVWRDTQQRRFTTGPRDRLAEIVRVRFGDEAEQVIEALISASLAEVTEKGRVRVQGNRQHVERLREYRKTASIGGRNRAKSATRGKDGTFNPGDIQPNPGDIQATSSGVQRSCLLTPTRKTNTGRTRAVTGAAPKNATGDAKREVRPTPDETAAKIAEYDRLRTNADPTAAKDALADIKRTLGFTVEPKT
jgi:hypothetical protein